MLHVNFVFPLLFQKYYSVVLLETLCMQRMVILENSQEVYLFHERQDVVGRQHKNIDVEIVYQQNVLWVNRGSRFKHTNNIPCNTKVVFLSGTVWNAGHKVKNKIE